MQTEMTTEAKGVDVLAVLSRRANESNAKYGADNEDMVVLSAVRRLFDDAHAMCEDLSMDMATGAHQNFRMVNSGNRLRNLRAALLSLHPEGGAK